AIFHLQPRDSFSPTKMGFWSRQAGDGYLSINWRIGEKIRKLNRTDIKIIYMCDDKEAVSKADVMLTGKRP
ncbi:MAG: hypothetical protein J5871_06220, partial [Bacteroidales bacterium]|nr:hypothetical protein [Bacteroidales bacterium]